MIFGNKTFSILYPVGVLILFAIAIWIEEKRIRPWPHSKEHDDEEV